MNLKEFLEQELISEETRDRVVGFKSSFDGLNLKGNWAEETGPLSPFKKWGRGAMNSQGQVKAASSGTDHANIKRTLGGAILTFYWGYLRDNQTLYIHPASIAPPGVLEKNGKAIANAVVSQMGFRKKT